MLKQRRVLFKSVQRRLYDLLLTRYGLICFLAGLLVILVFVLQLSDTILEYRIAYWRHLTNVITLQNASISLSISYHSSRSGEREEEDGVFDVVYTWVNGSDPVHLDLIRRYRNHSAVTTPRRVELADYLNQSISSYACYHKLCLQSNQVLVVSPALDNLVKKSLLSIHKASIGSIDRYSNYSVVYLDSNIDRNHLSQINSFLAKYKIYMGYYTIDCESANCIHLTQPVYILKKRKSLNPRQMSSHDRLAYISNQYLMNNLNNAPLSPLDDESDRHLPEWINSTLISKLDYVYKPPNEAAFDGNSDAANMTKKGSKSSNSKSDEFPLYLIRLKNRLEQDSIDANNTSWDVYPAKLVWDLGDASGEDVAAHRFEDNDELKYSLRSLEKHAPWVRNIYIVTNGQIPAWLDHNHPKIHLITHEDIFLNKSHLPTFSSPAIESHLHRIKGLSKRFIYFNDDTLLTRDVYADDFFTESRGFRFRLAWALPGCNAHCPQSWIGDGYCDRACNVTECEMDGGDCDMRNRTGSGVRTEHDTAREAFMKQSNHLFPEFYCSPGCSTSWLADKYCDNACNVKNCSYDMGDCGVGKYDEIYQAQIADLKPSSRYELILPTQLPSFYINFTDVQDPNFRVVQASYEENQLVRQISIVNKFSIITVLLMPESYRIRVNLPNSDPVVLNLNVNSTQMGVYNTTIIVKFDPSVNFTTYVSKQYSTTRIVTIDEKKTRPSERKQIKINKIDLEPKKINIKEKPIEISQPNYEQKIFRDLFSSYHSYLNWSFNSGYLTNEGVVYKLNLLDSKIRSEFNTTMNEIKNSDEIDLVLLSEVLSDLDKSSLVSRYLNETTVEEDNSPFVRFNKRKLLDTFADSLKHVNKLYNQLYGYAARKVPAHMPHYIDRSIMNDLQSKFTAEFDRTSSNRFRRSDDMQFAFAYYYHVMSEIDEFDAPKLFAELDLNDNGRLDASELMLISLRMSDRPFTASDLVPNMASVEEMRSINPEIISSLNSCNLTQSGLDKSSFLSCESLLNALKPYLWMRDGTKPRMKYKFEVLGDEETKFIMIAGEPIDIEVKLANYMREPRKFLCLNDNIDYVLKNEAQRLKFLLRQFFETLFPVKSSFELDKPSMLNRTILPKPAKSTGPMSTHFNLVWLFYITLVFFVFVFVRHFVKKCGRPKTDSRGIKKDCSGVSEVIERKISSLLDDDNDDNDEEDDDRRSCEKTPNSSSSNESSCVLVNEKEKQRSSNVSMRSTTKASTSKKHSKKKTFVI